MNQSTKNPGLRFTHEGVPHQLRLLKEKYLEKTLTT